MMRLHGFHRSGTSYRVRIALNLKGIAYDTVPVSLTRGEHHREPFRSLNPQGLVPVLECEDRVFIQSVAILEYLEERFPSPPLLPADMAGRARVRAMAALVGCDIHPINNLRVLNYLRAELHQDEEGVRRWTQRWIADGFAALDTLLASGTQSGGVPAGTAAFCHGAAPTLADVYLMPQIYSARRFGVDLAAYPRITAIEKECGALEAFAAAHPDRQPDAI